MMVRLEIFGRGTQRKRGGGVRVARCLWPIYRVHQIVRIAY